MAKIKVTLVKSLIGRKKDHIATANALGLRKINKTVEHEDTPQIRGMINKVDYLLKVEEDRAFAITRLISEWKVEGIKNPENHLICIYPQTGIAEGCIF